MKIPTGWYRHFKGGLYEVIAVARHSETLEETVVYRHADDGSCWVRPASMWGETVEYNGKTVPRFSPIETEMKDNG